MAEINLGEVLSNGLAFKFYVPVEDCPDIEQFVGKYIRVTLDGAMEFIGDLVKVSTWKKTEKGEIVGIYKEISMLIECLSAKNGELRFPDKKEQFMESFSIMYATPE